MARPAEFDKDEAIAQAIGVFARHGYEAASTNDLLAAMGIARQSLYGAFGDKRGLFLEALRAYAARQHAEMLAALAGSDSAVEGLEAALMFGLASGEDLERGCLGVGSIAEFGRSDPDVATLNDDAGRRLIAAFAERIHHGVLTGEFDPALDPEMAARFLLTVKSGAKVTSRGGADESEVREAIRLALRGLRPAPSPPRA